MGAQNQATQKPRRWLIGCSVVAGVLTLGLVVGVAVLYVKFIDFGSAAAEAGAAEKAYRAAGLPWEAKDLKRGNFTADQNAAPLLKRAFVALSTKKFDKDLATVQKLAAVDSFQEASKLLDVYGPALAIAEQASLKPDFDFGHDWDQGTTLLFPELASMKRLVKALCLRARIEAGSNEIDLATRDLTTGWKLSVLAGEEPTIISMLVQIAGQRIVLDAIQRCAAKLKENDPALAGFEKIIENPAERPILGYGMRGEAYIGLATVRNLSSLNYALDHQTDSGNAPPMDPAKVIRTGLPTDTKQRAFAARHLQAWTEAKLVLDTYENDPAKQRTELVRLENRWGEKREVSNLLVAMLFPVYGNAATAVVDTGAEIAATHGLLEAFRLKAHTGKWPTTVEEIPGKWTDIYTGKPLKIKLSGDSIRIYSLGPNLKDDGGVRKQEIKDDAQKDNYDVVASYPPRKIKT